VVDRAVHVAGPEELLPADEELVDRGVIVHAFKVSGEQ
jgi:hypothetical protein